MKVYISGKIGEEIPSPETIAKFKRAEMKLRSREYEVFNPTTSGLGAHAESLACKNGTSFYEEIMFLDLQELKKCDAVLVLPDWRNSPGAKTEVMWAKALKKPIWEEAPNGRLFEVNIDATKIVDYTSHDNAMTVGELKKFLNLQNDTDPVFTAADFILGDPFVQSFDKQVHGVVYEARIDDDLKAPHGKRIVFDSYIICSINFD